jgi:Tol biopolymer transport system component
VAALATTAALAGVAGATSLPERTFELSTPSAGQLGNGASSNPVLSTSGRVVAFESAATNLGAGPVAPATRNVIALDLLTGARRLVSAGVGNAPANGSSTGPAISSDGSVVVFDSTATNLTGGGGPVLPNVYWRSGYGPIVRVSVAADGGPANGPSTRSVVSADGRYVAFVSTATNLVAGDHSRQPQVFVRDVVGGRTARVSDGLGGADPDGPSSDPAISADGATVSFDSSASNLVPGRHRHGLSDVYVRVLATGRTERVSVSTSGREQNRAVKAPFHQISSLSSDGRFVVFDSDASNLVAHDINRSTDVFLRDRRLHRTTLVSENSRGYEGNNDSFAPSVTPDGRFVAFESFASNLATGGGPRENVYVRDLALNATSVIDVAQRGAPPTRELVKQLLQRPTLSGDGSLAVFTSTALNMTNDRHGVENVFLRFMAAPRGEVAIDPGRRSRVRRLRIKLKADDPHATYFLCKIDPFPAELCPGGTAFTIRRHLQAGHHVLLVRAGGPGMLFDPVGVRVGFTVKR